MEFQSVSSSVVSVMESWFGISIASFVFLLCIRSHIARNRNQPLYHWPFLGSLPSIISNSHRLSEWISELFLSLGKGVQSVYVKGPIFTNMNYLLTCSPINWEYVLKTNPSNFTKGSQLKEILDIVGDGITTCDGESWRFQRKMAHRAFTSKEFRSCVASTGVALVESELLPFLHLVAHQGSVIDLQDICTRFSFDYTTFILHGRHERHLSVGLPSNELSQAFHDVHQALLLRHVWPKFWWKLHRFFRIGHEGDYARAWKSIDKLLERNISQKKESLAKGEETVNDILSIYINYLEESPEDNKHLTAARLNKRFLIEAFLNLFVAGKDAVASGLTWFFWLVARTPRVEEKILQELKILAIRNKQGKQNDAPTKWPFAFDPNDLDDLVYLHAAICESLRLCPPVPLGKREVVEEDVLPDGSMVKPGMQIIMSIYAEGRMPWIWGEDNMEFRPERWIDENGKLSRELASKFFAFGGGARTCVGRNISFTMMKLAIAATLFNFKVQLVEGHQVCITTYLTLRIKDGLLVKISKRTV